MHHREKPLNGTRCTHIVFEKCSCGEWISLGAANDFSDAVRVEIRAAEIAAGLLDGGCEVSGMEQCGFNDEPPRLRGGGVLLIDTSSQRAGHLANVIVTHGADE